MCQFFAGDLYEVIPDVTKKSFANEEVLGECRTRSGEIELKKANSQALNVTLILDCDISTSGHGKVTDFTLELTLEVEGKAKTTHLDF